MPGTTDAPRDGAPVAGAELRGWLLAGGAALLALGIVLVFVGGADRPRWVGLDLLLIGALALAAGALDLPCRSARLDPARQIRLAVGLSGALLVLLWLPFILSEQSVQIAGTRYWFLGDDAMISMRYARSLADGQGLVWNPGERVEGFTNPLWTLAMAAVHLTGLPDARTSLPVLLLNLALAVAALPLVARLVRLLGGGLLAVAIALAAVVLNQSIAYWGTKGFETPLLALLVLFGTCRALEEHSRTPRPATYLAIGLVAVVRSDGLVLAALLWSLAVLLAEDKPRALLYAGAGLFLPIAEETFRRVYYGEWLPNTAYLKTARWDGRYATGAGYVFRFLARYAGAIALALAGATLAWERTARLLVIGIGVYGVYVGVAGGDAFDYFRFFLPVIPMLLALAAIGAERLARWGPWLPAVAAALLLLGTPLLLPDWGRAWIAPNRNDAGSVQLGLLIKQNTAPDARVADSAAGSVPYFSRRYAIDLLGKTDKHIARLPADPRSDRPGHNKFDYAYSLGVLRPDLVVSALRVPPPTPGADQAIRVNDTGPNAFAGALFADLIFREHFLPNRVTLDTPRTIFIADWSPEATRRGDWQPLDAGR